MYKEILVPLDGSALAEKALDHATQIGKAFKSNITLIKIIEPMSVYPEPGVIGPVFYVGTDIEAEMKDASDYLKHIADRLEFDGLEAKIAVREGEPCTEICEYAKEIGTQLIIMTTHGRSGLQRLFYGSVAESVLREASMPILLVRILADE